MDNTLISAPNEMNNDDGHLMWSHQHARMAIDYMLFGDQALRKYDTYDNRDNNLFNEIEPMQILSQTPPKHANKFLKEVKEIVKRLDDDRKQEVSEKIQEIEDILQKKSSEYQAPVIFAIVQDIRDFFNVAAQGDMDRLSRKYLGEEICNSDCPDDEVYFKDAFEGLSPALSQKFLGRIGEKEDNAENKIVAAARETLQANIPENFQGGGFARVKRYFGDAINDMMVLHEIEAIADNLRTDVADFYFKGSFEKIIVHDDLPEEYDLAGEAKEYLNNQMARILDLYTGIKSDNSRKTALAVFNTHGWAEPLFGLKDIEGPQSLVRKMQAAAPKYIEYAAAQIDGDPSIKPFVEYYQWYKHAAIMPQQATSSYYISPSTVGA